MVMLTSYYTVLKYVLKAYARNEQSSAADKAMATYDQPKLMTPTAYGRALCKKTYPCGVLYDQMRTNISFV